MGCPTKETVTPEVIHNRPALSKIKYRVGHYASFRRAMLEAVSGYVRQEYDPAEPGIRPFQDWTTRASEDFGIAFFDMWAYLGDILTFYQERIANEAFLRTALQFESTNYLVSLIGYRPAPGKGAAADLVFEVEKQAMVKLSTGLLVQSVPGQDEKPQKFETIDDITAFASLNELFPQTTEPQLLVRGARRAVLTGVDLALREGDWFAIAGDERRRDPGSERWDVRRIVSIAEDREMGTTTVTWKEGLGSGARPWRGPIDPEPNPEFWIFRGQAWPFGYNAPDYNLFAVPLSDQQEAISNAFKAAFPDWNDKYLPEDRAHPEHLYLDTVYPEIVPGGWVALVTTTIDEKKYPKLKGYSQYIELYPISDVAETTRMNYTLSGKVTRLTVDIMKTGPDEGKPEHIDFFPIRGTTALIGAEQIPLADVPIGQSSKGVDDYLPPPVNGDVIKLDDDYPELHLKRRLVVAGTLVDEKGNATGEGAEAVEVSSIKRNPDDGTTITLTKPLKGSYARYSVRIYGNVARATHGETVADEAIGDGDASREFQSFVLKKQPVTYLSQAAAPGGVASTLSIRVDGILWDENAELYGQAGDGRVYVTRRDPDDTMHVHFGDGRTGARLVSGRNNVRATYRVGLGPDGNVPAKSLRTLLKKPLGLKRVHNPSSAAGGAAAEAAAAVKKNAPGTVRTFGRIVSLRDFEDAAREYVGVAKSRATWVWDGEGRVVHLVVAGDGGAGVEPIMTELQADLDARRDPHQPMRIRDFTRMPVSVDVNIVVDDAFILETVQTAADSGLRALFAFDSLDLGQTIHLSEVYKAIQAVDGVVAVDVDEFRFKYPEDRKDRGGDTLVQPRLLMAAGELGWVEDIDDLRISGARFRKREVS